MSKSVFVGLSGGVDSSVAALRLIKAGYKVTGVFIKVWHPDFLVCNWEQERLDAMRVAAKLGIPFLTCDAEAAYRDAVAKYFIDSYRLGLTPNPDVMCNKEVKFGAFYHFAMERGADYIATGHYAQAIKSGDQVELHRGLDTNKDQSYFLWTITNSILNKVMFPVGDSTKDLIRKEADEAGLITANKKDSQGICFLGQVDIPDFLSHYIDLENGSVLDSTGKVIGEHKGAFVYTVGQRHGFTIHDVNAARTPLYIIEKNILHNTITVSDEPPKLIDKTKIHLINYNQLTALAIGSVVDAQTRYRQKPFKVTVENISTDEIILSSNEISDAVATGQSCVLYQGTMCLLGGMIA